MDDPLTLSHPSSIAAPSLRPFADGVHWVVERDVVFAYPGWPEVRVPAGFVTDLASVPAAAQGFRSRVGTYSRAAIVHDWLYWTGACTRSQADRILYYAMLSSGSSRSVANQFHAAVSRFGSAAFAQNAAERAAGLPRIVPRDRFDRLDDHDWPTVRASLARVDATPAPAGPPPYCALGGASDGSR